MPDLQGYTLMLECASCGLKRRIPNFPTQCGLQMGQVLNEQNIGIVEKGCLRCGVWRFIVRSLPPPPPPPEQPVGWLQKP